MYNLAYICPCRRNVQCDVTQCINHKCMWYEYLKTAIPSRLPTLPIPVAKEYSHLICPVCHQLFKNPKHLPCHHSYCEECLEEIQEYSKVTCAVCRNEVTVPTGGVKNLPNNY